MEDKLIELLTEAFKFPVFLQGSLLEDEPYPTSFFTFWNDSTESRAFYDDDEHGIVWNYSLNFYSTDPLLVNCILLDAKKLLKANGWVVSGAGYSVVSDEQTHTGRGIELTYTEV